MNFLIDAQLPLALSDWLKSKGINSVHTLELPDKNKTTDAALLDLSLRENRIIISKDADFYDAFILHGRPEKLLLITPGNISNTQLLKIFEDNFERITQLFTNSSLLEMNKNHLIVHR